MKRSAVWPWRRIAGMSVLLGVSLFAVDVAFDLHWVWSLLISSVFWFSAYSFGRQDQTEAFGIRMVQFIKNRHDPDDV